MKTYKADDELERLLLNLGFIETTSKRNQLKKKKSFKLSKHARKEIYFDYINIVVINGMYIEDQKISLTEKELKCLLLFFFLKQSDYSEINKERSFTFNNISERIDSIYKMLDNLKKANSKNKKIGQWNRIIDTYENILN